MSTRVNNGASVNGQTNVVSAADLSTAGTKATYTCPAGRQAMVRFASWTQLVAGGTLIPKATVGGVTISFAAASATGTFVGQVALNAADTFTLVASATGAGATTDLSITAEEFLAA